jgi:hypothetical protein
MNFTEHPRLLARVAGVFYLIITACALFAYMYVRSQVIVPGDMAQTAANMLAHERLFRVGFSAAVVVVLCNPPRSRPSTCSTTSRLCTHSAFRNTALSSSRGRSKLLRVGRSGFGEPVSA